MKPSVKLVFAIFSAAAFVPGFAAAQAQASAPQANWANPTGIVWKDPYGLCWRAGYWTPAQATAECDPDLVSKPAPPPPPPPVAEVAPAPPPPPPPAPAPAPVVKPAPQTVTFSAGELFDFDKAVLKPEGKTALDKLMGDLQGTNYQSIAVTGHTDRIGSPAYNQKLSERRAQAVKAYLISKGVQSDRITAAGKGETQPITKPGDCKGPKSKKLIDCLQPDRRVEVVVTGTK